MMLTTLLLSFAGAPVAAATPIPAPATLEGLEVQWSAPSEFIAGSAFPVDITITAPAGGGVVAGWMLSPGAFTIDGQQVAVREASDPMQLPEGFTISGSVDLAPYVSQSGQFKLAYAGELLGEDPFVVSVLELAPEGLNFMEMPVDQLTNYNVVLQTNRGTMITEFWPEAAPGHVRNYLDLAYTGFYDGIIFHRVIPGFMIQGGDPTGTGTGSGPRQLDAEFSNDPKYAHERGVLSMARSNDPNSASCQFFVMHAKSPHLDGSYSAFGKLVKGLDVVDAIVTTPRGAGDRPKSPQTIEKAFVVMASGS